MENKRLSQDYSQKTNTQSQQKTIITNTNNTNQNTTIKPISIHLPKESKNTTYHEPLFTIPTIQITSPSAQKKEENDYISGEIRRSPKSRNLIKRNSHISTPEPVSPRKSYENNLLFNAIAQENYGILRDLLTITPQDINKKDKFGNTPLMIAARENYEECLTELLSQGNLDLNTVNRSNTNALHFACLNQHAKIVMILIKDYRINAAIPYETKTVRELINSDNKDLRRILFAMVSLNIEINKQAKIHTQSPTPPTIEQGAALVKELINKTYQEQKKDRNIPKQAQLPQFVTNEFIQKMLKYRIKELSKQKKDSSSELSASDSSSSSLKRTNSPFIKQPIYAQSKKELKDTLFVLAVKGNDLNYLKEVFSINLNGIRVIENNEFSPLMYSVHLNNEKALKILLAQEKLNPNLTTKAGITALFLAIKLADKEHYKQYYNLAKLLLKDPRVDSSIKNINNISIISLISRIPENETILHKVNCRVELDKKVNDLIAKEIELPSICHSSSVTTTEEENKNLPKILETELKESFKKLPPYINFKFIGTVLAIRKRNQEKNLQTNAALLSDTLQYFKKESELL